MRAKARFPSARKTCLAGSKFSDYTHQGNTRTKAKINHCTLPKFPAWTRRMHSILASLSALFKSDYLSIQPVPAKFKVPRTRLGDFSFSLLLPSLRHVAQVPVAPLAPDIQVVLQEPFRTTWCTARSSRSGTGSQSTRFDRFDTFFALCWF